MIYYVLADLVVAVHLAFLFFAVAGGFLVLRWRKLAWLHIPAALWAAMIEFFGWICPLTPLENRLLALAGGTSYEGGFVEHYLFPVLYPEGLTREIQFLLGGIVLIINLAIYSWVLGTLESKSLKSK